ncbi:MAG: carboxymuconolactone decarboxylase family protein [Planctomycetes bacterium]|nr:carboxymuconolactone decarboxylase family protein [Planctomycetota bacterium]
MPIAKRVEPATISFLLTGIDPLDRDDAVLAMAAAITADGHGEHARRLFDALLKLDPRPDPELIREAILQTHLFAGYPRALNSLAAFKDACKKAGNPLTGEIKLREHPLEGDDMALFRKRGKELFDAIYKDKADQIDRFAKSNSPDLADWAIVEGYGRVLARPLLEPRQRSLCIVAALIPLDVAPQLKGHVQGALNTGSTPEQLWKLLDVVGRLFNEGPETRGAKKTFEDVLGKQVMSEEEWEEDRKWQGF